MIAERSSEIVELVDAYIGYKPVPSAAQPIPITSRRPAKGLSDEDILRIASRARNGAKFQALMSGDTSYHGADDSSADAALVEILAFYTQDDAQLERLWGMSNLADRPKWQRADYRRRTINFVLSNQTETYQESSEPPLLRIQQAIQEKTAQATVAASVGGTVDRDLITEIEELQRRYDLVCLELEAIRNVDLKQASPTLVELAKFISNQTARGKVDAEGWVYVPYRRIAERAGVAENSVGRHVDKGVEAGFFEKYTERIVTQTRKPDPETGEIGAGEPGARVFTQKSYFRMDVSLGEQLRRLAEYSAPEDGKPKWGGKRVSCPEHPDAKVIVHKTYTCKECGKVLQGPDKKHKRAPALKVTQAINPRNSILVPTHSVLTRGTNLDGASAAMAS